MKNRHQFLIVVGLSLISFSSHGQARVSLKACMERASQDNIHFPQAIDRDTTITGVICREAKGRVIFVYENRLATLKADVPQGGIRRQATTIRNRLCSDPGLNSLLKLVDIEYAYYDAEGEFIGRLTNKIEDCSKR